MRFRRRIRRRTGKYLVRNDERRRPAVQTRSSWPSSERSSLSGTGRRRFSSGSRPLFAARFPGRFHRRPPASHCRKRLYEADPLVPSKCIAALL